MRFKVTGIFSLLAVVTWLVACTAQVDDTANGSRPAGASTAPGAERERPPTSVVVRPVTTSTTNNRVQAIGTGSALASAIVVPLSSGILTEVSISSGEQVEMGTVLAQLDAQEEQIVRDRALRSSEEAQRDLARIESLFSTATSTQAEVDAARATLDDATLALRDAELRLSRRTITAPIAGTVDIVRVKVGNHVNINETIAIIDDHSQITIDFWVPERFAGAISLGQRVDAQAFAMPGLTLEGEISAIANRIESDSRTLPLQARIDNADNRLRPGMSFKTTLHFPGDQYAAIDPLAVQWDSQGSFAWQVIDDMAQRTPLRIIQRNANQVLVESTLSENDQVIIEGVLSVIDGGTVRVSGAQREPDDAPETDEVNGLST